MSATSSPGSCEQIETAIQKTRIGGEHQAQCKAHVCKNVGHVSESDHDDGFARMFLAQLLGQEKMEKYIEQLLPKFRYGEIAPRGRSGREVMQADVDNPLDYPCESGGFRARKRLLPARRTSNSMFLPGFVSPMAFR